jgi:RNA polymerase sigma-70 factor, ECF subfamily
MTAETPGDRDKRDAALAAAGDTEAFARLVARWQDRMLGLAWRFCRDRTMAEDMAQEAFVRAFRALPRFRADAAFGTWLTAIALNTYRTAVRDRPPVPVVPLLASHAPVGAAGQADGVARRELAEIVRAQVLRLPDRYRTAMVLYYFQEQDVAETARILGVRAGTLKGRLYRGRQLLERRLRALGITDP